MEVKIEVLLNDNKFNFLSDENKAFISEFTRQMKIFGYDFGGEIENGFCWGNFMLIFSQIGSKTKKIIARIYIRDNNSIIWGKKEYKFSNGIVLRLYFSSIDKHNAYIENSPSHIKEPFINDHGVCSHCKENCRSRKIYTIAGKKMEKCDGIVFEYNDPKIENIEDYMNILRKFYEKKSQVK